MSAATAVALDWRWYGFDEFGPRELYAVLAAREAVFVVEQACAYQELDGYDALARHLVGWHGAEVGAYLRVFAPGIKYPEAALGRVLTLGAARGSGAGRELMVRGLAELDRAYPGRGVRISAQAHLERFYRSLGFARVSAEPYLEDGIPHVEMLRG